QDIRKMGGLGKSHPFAYWTFLIGTLALVGLPPLAGFYSKDAIVVGALMSGRPWLWALAAVGAGLTASYMMRLFALGFAGESADVAAFQRGAGARRAAAGAEAGVGRSRPVPPLKMVPLVVLTLLSVVGGVFAMPALAGVPGAAEGARVAAPPAHEAAVA